MPGTELWYLPTNRQIWAVSRQSRFDCDYRTVSVLRFLFGEKGDTYDSERPQRCKSSRTLGFLRVLLQCLPLRHQVTHFPHQRLMTIDDLL